VVRQPIGRLQQRDVTAYTVIVDDAQLTVAKNRLTEAGLGGIAALIPNELVTVAKNLPDDHPLYELLFTASSANSVTAVLTNTAFTEISKWLPSAEGKGEAGWWTRQLRMLADDPGNASGRLAEIRALGSMLSNQASISGGLRPRINRASGRSADFLVGADSSVHVEVCTVRINGDELRRLQDLDHKAESLQAVARAAAEEHLASTTNSEAHATASAEWKSGSEIRRHQVTATAMRREDGTVATFTLATKVVRPYGAPKPEGTSHTVISRLAGRKPSGQIPPDRPGVLWLDLCDPSWSFSIRNAQPVELFRLGMALASTSGLWHSFYGRAGITPIFERAAVNIVFGDEEPQWEPQAFDGRFRSPQNRAWSAAVLRCTDGVVVFEHPNPIVRLPLSVLREFAALPGYSAETSFHRFDDDDSLELMRRLDDTERRIRFYAP